MLPASFRLRSLLPITALILLTTSQDGNARFSRPFSHFHDSEEVRQASKNLDRFTTAARRGDPEALPALQQLVDQFHALKRPDLELRARATAGAACLSEDRYRDAVQALSPALPLARSQGDDFALLSISNNLSWVHLKMNNLTVAAELGDTAIEASRRLGKLDSRPLMMRGVIYSESGDIRNAEKLFSQAIDLALDSNDLDSAATSWNFRSVALYKAHMLPEAERAGIESLQLRTRNHLPGVEVSQRDLGRVLAARGDLKTGSLLMNKAVLAMGSQRNSAPAWVFHRERGRLRMIEGNYAGAVEDLRAALASARRVDVIQTDDDRVTFESGLEDLYGLFIEAGNRLWFSNRDARLKQEVFEAAEETRAASLRALVPQPGGWRTRLPADYSQLVSQLEATERQLVEAPNPPLEERARTLHLQLEQMEARAGSEETSFEESSLSRARKALDDQSAILAFHLGSHTSFLWSLTSEDLSVFPLPSKGDIAAASSRFRAAVEHGSADVQQLAAALGQELLGQLPEPVRRKERWIIALDKDLFELPVAALRLDGKYLIEQHSILLTPSLGLLRRAGSVPVLEGFAGFGDAIYNPADKRWNHKKLLNWPDADSQLNLTRLPGSGREVKAALNVWGKGALYTGAQASKANVAKALAAGPGILHLATHVVKAPRSRSGMIVLSLDGKGELDYLDMRQIVLQPIQTELVVMSGCASGDAIALPASGLMGLTRAWLGAGAGEVLATRWPALDDSGPFFEKFYQELKRNPSLGGAEALRFAQLQMLREGGFRSSPEYWASYFLIGKS